MTHPRAFVLTVKKTLQKCEATMEHLRTVGVNAEIFFGLDSNAMNLTPNNLFEWHGKSLGHDQKTGKPIPGEKIGVRQVGACLSHLMMWKVATYMPDDSFWFLEDDVEFVPNWKDVYRKAMMNLPSDWDVLFIGSCCTAGKPVQEVGGGLFHVAYPMCGHALQIRQKALPFLIETHQRMWASLDIAMLYESLPKLNVYTILPRMVSQRGTYIPP